jgi:hypothetical protein
MEVFAKDGSAPTPASAVVADAPATPATPASAPAETAVATTPKNMSVASGGLVLGDKLPTFEEIIIPRLNLVMNIGKMTESFEPGELVYGQGLVLYTPPKVNAQNVVVRAGTPPLNLTVLGFRPTRYVEKVAGGTRGLIVHTEEDVRKAGGTLDYNEWNMKKNDGLKRFEYLADAVIVIRRPTDQVTVDGNTQDRIPDDDSSFIFEVEGNKYCLALWAMKGSVYTAAAKRVFFTQRQMGCLRKGGYPSWNYSVTTYEAPFQNNQKSWLPKCEPVKANTPEFLKWVAEDILSQK